ncbi:unnamed protein product [Blepharisma stoltei]|uniref:Uncharacterized protein n=1 Tax=Blepharisma stoltei TaxID=1481888 RepID=A0AAU9JLP1_9CILI|nr:unnamed protein product [Blepharisma stoltei]
MNASSKPRSRFYIELPSLLKSNVTRQVSTTSLFSLTAAPQKSLSAACSPSNALAYESEDEDRDAVEKLDFKEKEGQIDFIQSIQEAKATLQKRVSGEDLVEGHILERKYRNRLPNLAKKKKGIDSPKFTARQRMTKKHEDEGFKDKCRYFKLYEEELEKTYEKLLRDLSQIHRKREDLRRECLDIKKQSVIIAAEIEKIKSQIAAQETKEMRRKKRTQEEFAEWTSRKGTLKDQLTKKQEEAAALAISIQEEISKRAEPLAYLDSQSTLIRKQLGAVKDAQISHYLSLLKEGKDTRSEGLSWIIKQLWRLNLAVSPDMFPNFLDNDAIHCIIFIAQKSLEADHLSEEIGKSERKGSCSLISNDKWNNIHARLFQLTKNVQTQRPKMVWDKASKQMVVIYEDENKPNEDETSKLKSATESKINDQQLQSIKEILKKTKELELQRLAQECMLSNYEGKFNITLKELLSAIAGVESLDRYMAVITKEQKQLKDRLESTKTFSFARS